MSVVGGLFSDVFKSQNMAVPGDANTIDWSKAGGNPADLNWEAIKPFQVIPPMSWASTTKDATAPEEAKKQLDGIESTDGRSEYQKWLDIQKSTDGSRGRDNDRTGGAAGNGTNFTDQQWSDIKEMNNAYGFMGNPVNQIGLGAFAKMALPGAVGLFGLSNENPFTAQQRSIDAINQWGVDRNTIQQTQQAQNALAASIDADPTYGGGGYQGVGGTTTATGAGIASNPMSVDPATAQGQQNGGYSGNDSNTAEGGNYSGGYDGGRSYGY